jgi:hypothetical protein
MPAMKMIHKICGSLYPRIGQFADFLTVEAIPSPAAKLFVEFKDELGVNEFDKGIGHIA